jgi:hypothetical protein
MRRFVPVLLLAAAPVVAYAPAWREGRLLAPGDGAALHLPLRVETFRAWQRGEVPSWNASIFSGTPLLASYRPGALHPLMLALAPLPPLVAFQLLVLVALSLTGPLAYLYCRRLGAGVVGGLLAGLGFGLGPHLVAHLGDTATLVAAPALPLLLLAAEHQLSRPRHTLLATLGLAGAVALVLVSGSTAAVGAAALLLGARLLLAFLPRLVRGDGADARRILSTAAAVVGGLLLAAPQLLPTLIAAREAGPGGTGMADGAAAPLEGIAGFVVRYVSHSPAPIFALSAVPLLRRLPALRAAAAVVGLVLALFALRGPEASGPLLLAFDLALAVLAGLALDAQWQARGEESGARVRMLALVCALFAAAALSVATTVTGPLAPELQAPVGLLALALILHFVLAGSKDPVYAHVFLLPLVASFLMQPLGRVAWAGAPLAAELQQKTPTRAALDRAMGERVDERLLSLSLGWPRPRARDLAWANLASFTGHRNANGYDPMAPRERLLALGGMRSDGTVSRELLETDPGRLELLGVRWVQVPTQELAATGDASGLGEPLDVILEPPRPHLFSIPITRATEVRILSYLSGSVDVEDQKLVAECVARLASGREISLPIRAGVDTAEWAWDRADVRGRVRHARPQVHATFTTGQGFVGNQYLGILRLPGRYALRSLRFRALEGAPPLRIVRAGLFDAESSRGTGLTTAAAFVSDEVRLAEAAFTPLVSLFVVRRGIGPAYVVDSLRVLPDAERVLEVLRSPTRFGVDTRREALAAQADAVGVVLPESSRSRPADLARAAGGRLVVRAEGPGLLVIGEGYDAGFTALLDDAPTRVLRVNADRIGVVLPEGTHRVALTHRARGFAAGVVIAALAALALVLGSLRAASSTRGAAPHPPDPPARSRE